MISQDSGHQGAQSPGFQNQPADRRITDLAEEVQQRDPTAQYHDLMSDTHRTVQVNDQRFRNSNPIVVGMVVHALPYLNWYKVQLGEGGSFVPCMMGAESSFLPLGVRSTSPVPALSKVVVLMPQGLTRGIILCVLPEEIIEGVINVSDWVQQGGCSGVKREQAHMQPITNLFREGGVKDFSSHRPVDGTSMEWGKMAETGVGIVIDAFQAYLRVNEACGVFLNYFDSHTRIAGVQLDIQSYARQIESREDEGECQYIEGNIIYPWEAVGCYSANTDFAADFADKDVHYDKPRASIDLPEGAEDIQPVHRGVEYGGYLGQGYLRMMTKGARDEGKRLFSDTDNDIGLFQEHIALDGSYSVRSAKSVIIGKRVLIPVPKRKRLREDQKTGDDARKDNYKFSGEFGAGNEHKVGDVKVEGEQQHMRHVSGVLDILSYHYNWKGLHAFHYHEEDYQLADEQDLNYNFNRATDNLNFGELASQEFMSYPEAKRIKIDHRYGEVGYFQRESYLVFHEDGSVCLGDGYGSQISMSAGQIRLESVGDVLLLPGKRVVSLSTEHIIRAKNSVDISSSDKDVRIKAEKNIQVLAGNGGTGGILLESKSTGRSQVYENKYGEDVYSSGIVMLAKHSDVGVLAGDIYLRTGGGTLKNGSITLDASKGSSNIYYYGKSHAFFAADAVDIWHAPSGESANAVHSHRFSGSFSKIDGTLILDKDVLVTNGNLIVSKNIVGGENVIAVKKLAQSGGIFVGDHKGQVKVDTEIQQGVQASQKHIDIGSDVFDAQIVQSWYGKDKLGNEQSLDQMGFSFRDPVDSPTQYRTQEFKLPETRWQQYARNGLGSGGVAWTENPVTYQGAKTYPWPGKQKWVDDQSQLQYQAHTLFDEGLGLSKSRPGPYEDPTLSDWNEQKLDGNYKLIN